MEVARLLSQDSGILEHLASIGVKPGAEIRIDAREVGGRGLNVRIDGRTCVIDEELARLIRGSAIRAA
jgi:Fe2+ transport system protein FeoA